MFILPLLFFLLLTGYLWKTHRGLDISVYMSLLYVTTSAMAVWIIMGDMMGEGGILFKNDNAEFNIVPTLLYCVFIGLCIMPFSMIHVREIKNITIRVPWVLDALSFMLIALALLNLYLVADSTMDILSGDLGSIRAEHYAGAETPAQQKAESLPFILRFFYYFTPATILSVPIFFVNICFRHKPWWLNGMLAFASLTAPIAGIQSADRTEFMYLSQMILFTLILFYHLLTRRTKIALALMGIPIAIAGVVYVTAVSMSRFEDRSGISSTDRTIQYAGQGYINFCFFYENANTDYVSAEREFPLYHHYIKHKDSNAERRTKRMIQQGFFMSVFATFLGDMILDIGRLGMMVWAIFYFLAAMLAIKAPHRTEMDVSELLVIYLLAIVPIFGIFYYRFFAFPNTFTFGLVLAIYAFTRLTKKKPNEDLCDNSNV